MTAVCNSRESGQRRSRNVREDRKDATKLYKAIEAKLGAQRRFIIWFDQTFHGGDVKRGGNRQIADLRIEAIPDKDTRSRWRKRLKDPKKFDAALTKAHERCVKVCEARQGHSEITPRRWRRPADGLIKTLVLRGL